MAIADQLTLVANTKAGIKAAIEAKGVTVGAVPFGDYPAKITAIAGGGGPLPPASVGIPPAYTRPLDWLTRPALTNADHKLVGVFAVFPDASYLALSAAGNYTVDWGDGLIENFASGIQANHLYDYANPALAGTECTRGYKQAIVTVTPQAGQAFTLININKRHSQTGLGVYGTGWLDVAVAGASLTTLKISDASQSIKHNFLEIASVYQNAVTDLSYILHSCNVLQSVPVLYTNAATFLLGVYASCPSLVTTPNLTTPLVTNTTSLYQYCTALRTPGTLSGSGLTNTSGMFYGCTALQEVPLFSTGSVTNMSSMFFNCHALRVVPLFDTANVTDMTQMFFYCGALAELPLFNTVKLFSAQQMLSNCVSLAAVPAWNTPALWRTDNMFQACQSLKTAPALNMALVNLAYSMFTDCFALTFCPDYNMPACTTTNSMFFNCKSLVKTPALTTPLVNDMSNMYYNCKSLEVAVLMNTANVTTMYSMFYNCSALLTLPLYNTVKVTNFGYMFGNCIKLATIPQFASAAAISMGMMMSGCTSLTSFPLLNTALVTDAYGVFSTCGSLRAVPALNFTSAGSGAFNQIFASCGNIARCDILGVKGTLSVSSTMLSVARLEDLFRNLGKAASQTITISSSLGAAMAPVISKTTSGATTGSNVVTQANTSTLAVGMWVNSTALTPVAPVTFQTTANTVTRVGHGIPDGTPVSFSTITTTTGIVILVVYYVINAATDTFQLSLTVGGVPITLTTNGSGNVNYGNYITAITTNVSFTVLIPSTLTISQTVSARALNASLATLKGWTVSG